MNLELTKEEGQQLIQLIDIANRTQGLQISEVCLMLAKKIQDAINAE